MWGYILLTIIFGLSYLAYIIKTKVFDYEDYLENTWCKSNKWFPTPEEENLDNPYLPVSTDINLSSDRLLFSGGDANGNLILIAMERASCNTARVKAHLYLSDGRKLETFGEMEELLPSLDWTCRDFSFQKMEPFESWRIVINTVMRSGQSYFHVNMRFMWRASSTPIYLHENTEHKMYYSVQKRADTLWGHDQYGILSGTVVIDGNSSNIHYLTAKHRSWHTCNTVYVQSDYEQMFTLKFSQRACSGHFFKFNKAFDVFKETDILQNGNQVEISILMPDKSTKKYCLNREKSTQSVNTMDKVFCFNFKSLLPDGSQYKAAPPLSLLNIPPTNDTLLVSLSDEQAMNSSAVGGKAANLAILKRLIEEEKAAQINIPAGFCITAEAYRQHIASNSTISNVISQLDFTHEDDLEIKCEKLQSLWLSSRLSEDLQTLLSSHLDPGAIYAVRSSGTEEDTGSSSAAGQNESVLGVSGERRVGESVLMCWSSLFSYQSVQYRRKNGLNVSSSEMCVLIQELVPNVHAAGVLFSCDPVTGNPWTSVVSCNFGLGLSVVGATCDPDTFTVSYDGANHYQVKSKKCGNKGNKTIFEGDIIQDITLSAEDNATYSISDKQATRLAQLGDAIRRLFGFECDVEWVLDKESTLHVVQVRPVTSIYNWTDYELTHEFDSPIHEGYDFLTFHNIGEACPGFVSPLSLTPMKVFDRTIHEMVKYFADSNAILYNTVMYSYHATIALFNTTLLVEDDPISQIILCGQVVSTPEVHQLFLRRNPHVSASIKLKMTLFILTNAVRSESITNKTIALAENLNILVSDNPIEMVDNILDALSTFQLVGYYHCSISAVSALVQRILIMSVVRNGIKELSNDSFAQVANAIINSTNTVSVDITHQFKNIVASIVSEDEELQFLSVDSSDGLDWLHQKCPRSYELLEQFFVKFGHRGNKEIDLLSETWAMNKPKVVEMLRTLVQAKSKHDASNENRNSDVKNENRNSDDNNQASGNLDRSGILKDSKIMKLLLPVARKVVARRELTKNALVLTVHKIRLAVLHLGVTMQRAGLIPHSRLIFFLTMYEVKQILTGRNSTAISKALRRDRLSSKLDKLIFHPQSLGRPVLVNREPKVLRTGKRLSGTPVWPGELLGTAKVILDLSGATSISQGDVLITHATDTGWTPYFSMLGGLVTELGGILSHGAVVAREYGLPCIVGVDDATLYFRTGDNVLLNSSKGTIEKVVEEHET